MKERLPQEQIHDSQGADFKFHFLIQWKELAEVHVKKQKKKTIIRVEDQSRRQRNRTLFHTQLKKNSEQFGLIVHGWKKTQPNLNNPFLKGCTDETWE